MSKIRVYELAKELNKSSKDIIYALKRNGIDVESHMSFLSSEKADRIRSYFTRGGADPKKQAARPQQGVPARPRQAAAQPRRRESFSGGLDSNGNFTMFAGEGGYSFDGRPGRSEGAPAKRSARPETAQKTERADQAVKAEAGAAAAAQAAAEQKKAEAAAEVKPAQEAPVKSESKAEVKAEVKTEAAAAVKTEEVKAAARTEAKAPDQGQTRAKEAGTGAAQGGAARGGQRDGQSRPAGRDGQGQGRPAGRDGQNRPYNRDGQGQGRPGQGRPGGRDGQNRPYNRDGQGQGRPGGRDGQGRPAGRDGQGRPAGRDGQGRSGQAQGRPGQGRPGQGRFSDAPKDVVVTKDTSRENRRSYNNKDRDNKRDEKFYDDKAKGRNGKSSKQPVHNKNQQRKKPAPAPKPAKVEEKITSIELPDMISIKDFADMIKIPANQIIKKLFMAGKMVNVNSDLTYDEAEEIAMDYDILCEHEEVVDVIEEMLKEEEENEEDMVVRPPVVCVMGHVDHGKTSILDAIRKTSVTSGEAGGITQHIGAYVVDVNGQKITFLDTPGHEAFTAMRLRGAQSTDIAILVVAADDGVMPQTIEAINHAKAAGIDIIVAINKIDKPSANIDRVKQELTEYDLVAEDWGGQTIMVPVSAHTGEGLQDLLDMILLDAEVKELKANPNRMGRGLILEAQLDKGRGPVATVLVQKGTLHVGDNVTVGTAYGKIRAMIDDKGKRVKKAGPSTPVEILGLNDVPQAGEVFIATETEKEARSMAETFIATNREKMLAETKSRLSLDSLFEQIQEGQIKELNIIVKADVQGSVEAVKQSLSKLSNEEVAVKVIHGAVGAINESDVMLASASNAIIIGFNVRPDNQAKQTAEQENVDMRLYRVIYNAIEDIEAAMKGMLEPTFQEKIIGHAEVRQTYKVSGVGTIIGGYVQDGKIIRGCKVRLLRDNVVIHDGELASLKRFKDDVKEVNSGYECGMSFEKYNDIKEGDQIEAYVMEEVPR